MDKTLTLKLAERVLNGSVLVFSLELHNAFVGQDAQQVRIKGFASAHDTSSSINITLQEIQMDSDQGNGAPLLIARFNTLSIRQTTSQMQVDNTMTFVVALNVDVKNATMVLSGLKQTNSADQLLALSYDSYNQTRNFGETGRWIKATGTLILYASVRPGQTYVVNFTLTNPDYGQASPPVYVEMYESDYSTPRSVFMSRRVVPYPFYAVAPLFVYGKLSAMEARAAASSRPRSIQHSRPRPRPLYLSCPPHLILHVLALTVWTRQVWWRGASTRPRSFPARPTLLPCRWDRPWHKRA